MKKDYSRNVHYLCDVCGVCLNQIDDSYYLLLSKRVGTWRHGGSNDFRKVICPVCLEYYFMPKIRGE